MRKSEILVLAIIAVSLVVGIYFYPQMPVKMASHWGFQNQVNGYLSKFWGLFLMPVISFFLFLLFFLIPRIDPLRANIAKFRKYFDWFVVLIILFLFYLDLLTIFWNMGFQFQMIQLLAPAFGILFYYTGVLIENSKRNWFIGIRTPWTLSSETVWNKTHQVGAKCFKIYGLISLLGVILPNLAIFFVLGPIILVSFYTIIFSYVEYQKEEKKIKK